jgi:hypothetical protein
MARTTAVIGFSVPPALRRELERVSREERRTKSELFREMFRVYQRYREQKRDEDDLRWVNKLIEEAQREQREHPMSYEEALAESRRLARSGARRAKKLGIKTTPEEIAKWIRADRAERRRNA